MGRLISRANTLAEFYGSGMLYDNQETLTILGKCRQVALKRALRAVKKLKARSKYLTTLSLAITSLSDEGCKVHKNSATCSLHPPFHA